MTSSELFMWVSGLGAVVMGGWRMLRALISVVRALEGIEKLSGAFTEWTRDMRTWQGETEHRLTKLETLQKVGGDE